MMHILKEIYKIVKEQGQEEVNRIAYNTYRTLMTRGMKDCYVYFADKKLFEFINKAINM